MHRPTACRVGIVIVNYNSTEYLEDCLNSLQASHTNPVLVWDNGSRPETLVRTRELAGRFTNVNLIEHPCNLGFGAAVNRAVECLLEGNSELEYVWVVNPDVVVDGACLETLMSEARRHDWDLASPKILMAGDKSDRVWYSGGHLDRPAGRSVHWDIGRRDVSRQPPRAITFISGAAVLIKSSTWRELGGFREDLFLYCEDAELSMRYVDYGASLGVSQAAIAWHWEGRSSEANGRSANFYYYVQRNRLTVYADHGGKWALLLGSGAPETLRLILNTLRPLRRDSLGKLKASLAGVYDGVRGITGQRLNR